MLVAYIFLFPSEILQATAVAAFENGIKIQTIIDKVDLHTRTIVEMQESLATITRMLTRHDRPINPDELTANPQLHPLLAGFIPFSHPLQVSKFFQSKDRILALQVWVYVSIPWDPNYFVNRMCDALMTFEFRIKYSFPGKLR